jgi:hypothetical protein
MMNELTGLELAKYIFLRLVNNNESIEQLAEDFDNDFRFVSNVVQFLKELRWIRQDSTGGYQKE